MRPHRICGASAAGTMTAIVVKTYKEVPFLKILKWFFLALSSPSFFILLSSFERAVRSTFR